MTENLAPRIVTRPAFDNAQWSTVDMQVSFWWRVKALFRQPRITFCWGQDRWCVRGKIIATVEREEQEG